RTPHRAPSSAAPDGSPEPLATLTPVGAYRIHSVEFGTRGDPLVLVHGLSGSSRWWHRNIAGLAAAYRVMVPDLIGFGRTRRPRIRLPTPRVVAGVLAEWMNARGIERAHLVGHSMGGQLS